MGSALGKTTDQTQILDPDPSSLCVTGHRPHIMTGIFVWLSISHFASESNIVDEDLREHKWSQTDADAGVVTGIQIQALTRWSPAQLQYRPAIYVKRNAVNPVQLGIDNRYQDMGSTYPGIQVNSYYSLLDGGDKFETLLVGSHTLFCLGETGLAVEKLGAEVYFRYLEFSARIREDLGLHKFRVMELGPVQKLEESKEHWVVPVTLGHVVNHAWTLRMETPILKGASIEMLEHLGG